MSTDRSASITCWFMAASVGLSAMEADPPSSTTYDLRLGLGLVPGIADVAITAPAWGGTAHTEARLSPAITPACVLAKCWRSGFGLGLSLAIPLRRSIGIADHGDRFTVDAYGGELAPLIAWHLASRLHLEWALPLAAGFAHHGVTDLDGDQGTWWSTGLRLGGYWTTVDGWQYGGELGWMAMTTLGRVTNDMGGMDLAYHSRGPTITITLGHRL